MKKEKLVIIDGHALIHRSFHALPITLKTPDGIVSNAVYGFTSFLLKALTEIKPDYAIVAFDLAEKTFRHKMYEEYKATRIKAPDELYEQIPLIKDVLKSLNILIIEKASYEADDIIGTIANLAYSKNLESIIITGDLDTLQLVNKGVKVYTMSRGLNDSIIYDIDKIKERYSLEPKQIIDLKAIKGDPSDNIIGVKGIGEKGAIDLLLQFNNLKELLKAADNNDKRIKDRNLKLLHEQKQEALLSYDLVKIDCQVPIEINWKQAIFPNFKKQEVVKLFQKLGFNSLLNKIQAIKTQEEDPDLDIEVIKIDKEEQISGMLNKLKQSSKLSLDLIEEDSKKTNILISNDKLNYQIPLNYLAKIKDIFDKKNKIIAFDFKRIIKFLWQHKVDIKNIYFDLLIAHYLLYPNQKVSDKQSLVFKELGLSNYQANYQAALNLKVFNNLEKELKTKKIDKLFYEIEMPLIKILAQMELNGITIDLNLLRNTIKKNKETIESLKKKIEKLAGKSFNLNSSKQLSEVLFKDLKISGDGIKKTKTSLSTADDELNKLRDKHEIIPLIQDYREVFKLHSTYLLPIKNLIKKDRLYTHWQQAITATGRLSSTEPNLQNLPIKTKVGRKIRELFIASKNYKLLGFDYSQIELRITAHLSEEKNLIDAFINNLDIHQRTASLIYQVKLEEVDEEMRQKAKAVNFGIIYGQGPHGLSLSSGLSFKESKDFIAKYFKTMPKVKEMMDKQIETAKKDEQASSLFGRLRPLRDINSNNFILKKAAERMAINMPIQGTAADMIKLAMIEINKEILQNNNDIKLLLQIHDELVFEVKENRIEKYQSTIKKIMENIVDLKVPIVINSKTGDNLAQLK
jgi:DNA polymerase I